MLNFSKNYPVTFITTTETTAVFAKGDCDGQFILHVKCHKTGKSAMVKSPAHLNLDAKAAAQGMLKGIIEEFGNVQVYDVPPGLTPEGLLAWGIENDLFKLSGIGMRPSKTREIPQ